MITSFLSRNEVVNNQGDLVAGAAVYVFDAGTLNPRVAYRNGGASPQPWTQPFFADVNGKIPNFWIAGTLDYRVMLYTKDQTQGGVFIEDNDNLTAEIALPVFPVVAGYGLSTGDCLIRFDTAEKAGFVKLNGKTLGSTASGADYADDGNQALYVLLYNGITALAVSGGRGASALADFGAAKTLTLPDLRGRVLVGLDTMGNSLANRLLNVIFGSGNSSTLGSTGGEALHVLTIAELAAHNHTGTTDASGAFTPAGALDSQGAHIHSGTTGAGSPHHHAYTGQQAQLVNIGTAPTSLGTGSQTLQTADESAHTHPFTTGSAGNHNHAFTGTAVAAHTHPFTGNNTGSGTPHNTMSPFMLVTFYCKI